MTYQEQFEKLFHAYAAATLHFFEVDKKLSKSNNANDVSHEPEFKEAAMEMKKRNDEYHEFLDLIDKLSIQSNGKFDVNSEYVEPGS